LILVKSAPRPLARLARKEKFMKTNEGITDRVIRMTAGYLILSAFFLIDGNARWLTLVGVVPLLTGLFGYCPLYTLIGVRTCALPKSA
jgi:hypothetical protein